MRNFTLITTFIAAVFIQGFIAYGQESVSPIYHIVYEGENVYRISLRYEVSMDSLRHWNNLDQFYTVAIGQRLIITNKKPNAVYNPVATNAVFNKTPINQDVAEFKAKLDTVPQVGSFTKQDSVLNVETSLSTDTLNLTTLLAKARELAYNNGRDKSRLVCRQILVHDSAYHDASVLMGRTYLWDGKYDSARFVLNRVIAQSAGYYDAMDALIDVGLMSDNYSDAIKFADIGLSYHKDDIPFLYKKARALNLSDNSKKALAVLSEILSIDPSNKDASGLKSSIRQGKMVNKITVNLSAYTFSNDVPWTFASASIGRKVPKLGSVTLRYNYAKRFGDEGHQFELDAYPTIVKGVYVYFNSGFSNQKNFPFSRLTIEPYFKLPASFEFSIGARYLNFDPDHIVSFGTHKVLIYTGTIGKYYGDYWISVRPYFVPGTAAWSKSVNLTVRRYLNGADNYLSLTLGTGMSPDEQQYAYDPFLNYLISYKVGLDFQHTIGDRFILGCGTGYTREEEGTSTYRDRFSFDMGGAFIF